MPSSIQGDVDDCKYLSVCVETQTPTNNDLPNCKNISRVVIVNERGERVLDTLVAPQTKDVNVKGGKKAVLFKFAELKAEKYEVVKQRVVELINGKCLIYPVDKK
jgi:hypothetical protein